MCLILITLCNEWWHCIIPALLTRLVLCSHTKKGSSYWRLLFADYVAQNSFKFQSLTLFFRFQNFIERLSLFEKSTLSMNCKFLLNCDFKIEKSSLSNIMMIASDYVLALFDFPWKIDCCLPSEISNFQLNKHSLTFSI